MIFSLSAPLRAPVVLLSEALGKLLSEATARTPTPLARLPSALSVVLFFRTRCTLGSDPRSVLLCRSGFEEIFFSDPNLTRAVTETGHWWVSGVVVVVAPPQKVL